MKKRMAVLLSALLLSATAAHAEHKLLITDVLDRGEFEAEATFEYLHTQASFERGIEAGRLIGNALESRYSLGAGLGHGLEVTAAIPYVLSERAKEQFNDPLTPSKYEKRDGFGDFAFGAKYALLPDHHAPVAVVLGLDVKFDTAGGNEAGTGTTDVSPYLAASMDLGHHTNPYASYRAVIRNHQAADRHEVTVGIEKGLCERFTLDARAVAAFATATNTTSSLETYTFELESYIQLVHNLYLLPAVIVGTGSPAHSKIAADDRTHSPFSVGGALSLYYLF